MPALMSQAIPVIDLSSARNRTFKGKAPAKAVLLLETRQYDDGPLPIHPSDRAPKDARIKGRVIEPNGVFYQLQLGDVDIGHVGVDEVLDYVSALQLEQFENASFLEEREVRRVAEEETRRLREEKVQRQKERAKRKGTVVFEEVDVENGTSEAGELARNRPGRARPDYKHLFKALKERRRRRRDPATGELMPLSDDEPESSLDPDEQASNMRSFESLADPVKRRRRKRDPLTGELLPLATVEPRKQVPQTTWRSGEIEQKRRRRKRHPVTGELMPLGWRYDSKKDSGADRSSPADVEAPLFQDLNISHEPGAKRQRLETESSVSRSPSPILNKAGIFAQLSQGKECFPSFSNTIQPNTSRMNTSTADDESERVYRTVPTGHSRLPKADTRLSAHGMLASTASSSDAEPDVVPRLKTSIQSPSVGTVALAGPAPNIKKSSLQTAAKGAATSMLSPSAARASSLEPSNHESSDEDDGETDEWVIEAVTAHCLSNPTTHPEAFGKEPVMLYQVKWEDYDEPTWEPAESFSDPSIVREYRHRAGLPPELDDSALEYGEDSIMGPEMSTDSKAAPSNAKNARKNESFDEDEDMDDVDEDEFEVESIQGHHLSDPRTHSKDMGKKPTMLYNVKWKGFKETTWEPLSSFQDPSVVLEYRRRVGVQR